MTDSVSKTGGTEPEPAAAGEENDVKGAGSAGERPAADDLRAAEERAAGDPEGLAEDEETLGEGAEDLEEAEIGAGVGELDEHAGEALDDELLGLREEFADLNDRHLRLAAEFNNYRRRVEAERLDVWSRAQADAVGRFLDVLDDLQRVAGLDLGNATVDAIMEGIDLVERKFVRMLGDLGVEVLDPAGERFDPESMEAMMRVPAESKEDEDRVAQVFQKGYKLKGALIRPARVSVFMHA